MVHIGCRFRSQWSQDSINASFNCVLREIKGPLCCGIGLEADFTGPISRVDIIGRYRILSGPKWVSLASRLPPLAAWGSQ